MSEELLFGDLTYRVIGLGMQVHTAPIHKAQTLNYLKATGLDFALIMNFVAPSFEHHRLINRLSKPSHLNTGRMPVARFAELCLRMVVSFRVGR